MDHGTMTGWDLIPVPEPAEASAHGDGPHPWALPEATATTSDLVSSPRRRSARRAAERAASVSGCGRWCWLLPPMCGFLRYLPCQTDPLVQLVRADTAFQDEAPYFRAGRLSMATRAGRPDRSRVTSPGRWSPARRLAQTGGQRRRQRPRPGILSGVLILGASVRPRPR